MVQFKTKCSRCKKNYVTVSSRSAYGATCFDCSKKDMAGEIKDPALKKMLDIPNELYAQSSFLRSIKINCLRYGGLSEKQIEIFKKVVEDLSAKKGKPAPAPKKEGVELADIQPSQMSMRAERLEKKRKAEERKAAKEKK